MVVVLFCFCVLFPAGLSTTEWIGSSQPTQIVAKKKRADQPRYSEKVHQFRMIFGADVVSTERAVGKVRDALAVPSGSANVAVPRELRPGRPIRDEGAKAALRPCAVALRGWLGPAGKDSLT